MDPEERRELLDLIDDELDDSPKGRTAKEIVKNLPLSSGEAGDRVPSRGEPAAPP